MSDFDPKPYIRELFEEVPRQGPGSDASTLRALSMLSPLPENPRILDIGCGAGDQTLVLARETGGEVTAVDIHRPVLDRLKEKAARAGLSGRITIMEADMADLPFEDGGFDLVWAEGSIFVMGLEEGLAAWRRLLAPGGQMAVSEAAWKVPDPPQEALEFWRSCYPAITGVEENLRIAVSQGYAVRGHFFLPDNDWMDLFYGPLENRLAIFAEKYKGDPHALEIVKETKRQMAVFARCSWAYGYLFMILGAGLAPDNLDSPGQ